MILEHRAQVVDTFRAVAKRFDEAAQHLRTAAIVLEDPEGTIETVNEHVDAVAAVLTRALPLMATLKGFLS